jgi:hypothetical protein
MEICESPKLNAFTTINIVPIVKIEKTAVTQKSVRKLKLAAGYINSGINGSQGPKTKIVNSIHGVKFGESVLA